MNNKLNVVYEIEDGYVGPSAPHEFTVDIEDILSVAETVEEAIAAVEETMQEEFQKNIHPYLTNTQELREAFEQALLEKQNEEE